MDGFRSNECDSILQSKFKEGTYVMLMVGEPNAAGNNFAVLEPSSVAGYKRAKLGEVDTTISRQIANKNTIFFEESIGVGYGTITHAGFAVGESDAPFFTGALLAAKTVGAGYIPIFRAHKLVIGLDTEGLQEYA